MFRLILIVASFVHELLRRSAPSNMLLSRLCTRRGLKWGVPAMLVGAGYSALAYCCTMLLDTGASSWLNLVVLLGIYNDFRFTLIGPVSLVRLIATHFREHRTDRRTAADPASSPPRPRSPPNHSKHKEKSALRLTTQGALLGRAGYRSLSA